MKLSVCVATFNRAGFILETLEALASELTADVELLVVDGASTDGTPDIMADFVRRHPEVVYRRQPVNGGVDQDFDIAVQFARGEFCWLMSDDDLIVPGAIAAVLARLDSGPDLLVVNAEIWSRDLAVQLKACHLEVPADREYGVTEQQQLFIDTGGYLSFIGGVVVRRSLWLSRARKPYYGTLFIHVGVLFQRPPLQRAAVMARPLIRIRYGNASWSARSFEIWIRKWPQLVWSFPLLTDDTKSRVTPREPATKARTLLWYRAVGAYGPPECRSLQGQPHHPLASAIARLPARLANAAVAGYVYLRGGTDTRMKLYDLARATSASAVAHWAARRAGVPASES